MRIFIFGSGNVATIFARKLYEEGHIISGVYSKNMENATSLAARVNSHGFNKIEDISINADMVIISVSDHAIEGLVNELGKIPLPVFHTAGSVSIETIKNLSSLYGVIYPLQSLRKNMERIPEIPLFVDGNNDESLELAKNIAGAIGEKVYEADDEKRKKLHLAAVFSSNFTNYLYTISKKYTEASGLPFESLIPLIEETAHRIKNYDPETMQTGPAIRGDMNIIEKHLQLLDSYPDWKEIYQDLSARIYREFNS